jgi:hypothetical protein
MKNKRTREILASLPIGIALGPHAMPVMSPASEGNNQ